MEMWNFTSASEIKTRQQRAASLSFSEPRAASTKLLTASQASGTGPQETEGHVQMGRKCGKLLMLHLLCCDSNLLCSPPKE